MKKYILVFLLLSTLKSSFIYTDINFSNNLNSIDGELGSSLLGYSHLVYTGESDNFNLYFGLSHTITPIVIKNNNIYSSESNLGIIDDYENVPVAFFHGTSDLVVPYDEGYPFTLNMCEMESRKYIK